MKLLCYDNGGKSIDRYTVVFVSKEDYLETKYENGKAYKVYNALAMDAQPFYAQGFGQHTDAIPGRHLGKKISFYDLPRDCRKCVCQDLSIELNEVSK